jgi:hypothetical protein
VAGTVGIDPTKNGVSVNNFPTTQPVSGTVSVSNLPTTETVSGTVSVSNLPTSQMVNGTVGIDPANNTVGIDPAHNQVSDATTTIHYIDSSAGYCNPTCVPNNPPAFVPGAGAPLNVPPIDVSAFKDATLAFGNYTSLLPMTVTLTDGHNWTIDTFSVPAAGPGAGNQGQLTRHYDYLPTELYITLTMPTSTHASDIGNWELDLYGRAN